MLTLVKETWKVRRINIINFGRPVWCITSTEGKRFQLPEQFCQRPLPSKKFWKKYHQVILDKIGPFVVGVTINGERIYLLDKDQYSLPVQRYLKEQEEEMEALLELLVPVQHCNTITLPSVMYFRELFFAEKLPLEELWRKKWNFDLFICYAIQKICDRNEIKDPSQAESIDREIIRLALFVAGFPVGYDKVLEVLIYETRCMLYAYLCDCKVAETSISQALKNSTFLTYHNSFVPLDISADEIQSYLQILIM